MRQKCAHIPGAGPPTLAQQFTGKDKFPSQHPWFGYK
jgi:hypothetical protein